MSSAPLQVPRSVMPSRLFRRRTLTIVAGVSIIGLALAWLSVNPLEFIRDFHFVVNLVSQMLPPNLELLWRKTSIWSSLVQTVAMAFLATLGGAAIAFLLALLAATTTTPSQVVRLAVRLILTTERCTPNIVVLLVLLIAVGIGPFAAMLSLLVGSIGMFGKLFADAIEQVDVGPVESTAVSGASRLQILRYAVLPQVAPSIVANVFYAFDVNLRAAVALGVFGGGGIGFELNVARSVLRYRDMLACLLVIIVMINLMERVADHVRRRIFALETELK
jgi:phosphonate transport system permease protein